EYSAEFHSRFVIILACIPFAIFALALGITNPRVPKKTGLLFMIMVLILYFSAHTQFFVRVDRGQTSPYILYVTPFMTLIFSLINFYRINYDYDTLNEMFRFTFFKKSLIEQDEEDIVST
ncbi:MAG: lipopolysaccharide export LptBFGC system permease protein LptF, partial [bacterium]